MKTVGAGMEGFEEIGEVLGGDARAGIFDEDFEHGADDLVGGDADLGPVGEKRMALERDW